MLTLTDMFCGAGGSSTGAIGVPGIEVRTAMNHWDKAIETHNTNHPDADHIHADISQTDPRYVRRSDILWASPECTNHSVAKGKRRTTNQADLFDEAPLPDEAAERSRATMWDVPRFAEHHHYRSIITENVVDAARWVMFDAWLHAMDSLGYNHHVVYLNSMHAQLGGLPAPQSRDRMYVIFWRKGDPRPDLDSVVRPKAYCPACDQVVDALQVFKKATRWGRYRAQYVYRCPNVTCRNRIIEPGWLPASSAIDWDIAAERIGDRSRPLSEKTMARIRAGLERYGHLIHVEAGGNQYDSMDPKHPQHGQPGAYIRAWPITDPLRTLHTANTKGIVIDAVRGAPILSSTDEAFRTQTTSYTRGLLTMLRGENAPKLDSEPLDTIAANGNHHGLLMPYYGASKEAKPTSEAMGTLTTVDRYALIMRNNTSKSDGAEMVTPADEPIRTITTKGHQSLLQARNIDVDDCQFRMLEPSEIKRGMAFPTEYVMLGTKREQVKLAGNAVTPPAARDLVSVVAEALGAAA